jgi:hypothetical protein
VAGHQVEGYAWEGVWRIASDGQPAAVTEDEGYWERTYDECGFLVGAEDYRESHADRVADDRVTVQRSCDFDSGGRTTRIVFRAVDERMVAFALLGVQNWIITWYRPDGSLTPTEIADQFADLFLAGLRADSKAAV